MPCSHSVQALFVFVVLGSTWHLSPAYAQLDEIGEPPLGINIAVDGQQIATQLGKPAIATINGKQVRIKVTASDERVLKLQHLSFRYPAYFKHKVRFRSGSKVPIFWELKGRDIEVTVFRASSQELEGHDAKRPLTGWLTSVFGEKLVEEDAAVLELGQVKLGGIHYRVPFDLGNTTEELHIEAYEVPGDFGNVRYILLLTDWDGKNPKEELRMRNLLRKSFNIVEEATNAE